MVSCQAASLIGSVGLADADPIGDGEDGFRHGLGADTGVQLDGCHQLWSRRDWLGVRAAIVRPVYGFHPKQILRHENASTVLRSTAALFDAPSRPSPDAACSTL